MLSKSVRLDFLSFLPMWMVASREIIPRDKIGLLTQ